MLSSSFSIVSMRSSVSRCGEEVVISMCRAADASKLISPPSLVDDAGLQFLSDMLSPSTVLSRPLLEQVVVIAISKPTYHEMQFDRSLSSRRTAKQARQAPPQALPTGLHTKNVEAARSLLLLHLQRIDFARRFLDILPVGYDKPNGKLSFTRSSVANPAPRRTRSSTSSTSPPADHSNPTAAAAEWLFDSDRRDVFDLLQALVQPRRAVEYVMEVSTSTVTAPRRQQPRRSKSPTKKAPNGSSSNEWEHTTPLALLRTEARVLQEDALDTEDLRSMLERQAPFDSSSAWKLLQLANTAWRTEQTDAQRTTYSHLGSQLRAPKRTDTATDEVGVLLDCAFAGLSVLDGVESAASSADFHLKCQTAVDLLAHTAQLVQAGVIDRQAVIRGIADRLCLVSLKGVRELSDRLPTLPALDDLLLRGIFSHCDIDMEGNAKEAPLAEVSDESLALACGFLQHELLHNSAARANETLPRDPSKDVGKAISDTAHFHALARNLALVTLLRRSSVAGQTERVYDHCLTAIRDHLATSDFELEQQDDRKDAPADAAGALLSWLGGKAKELKAQLQVVLDASQ